MINDELAAADLLKESLSHNKVWVNITGSSMSPLLRPGTRVLLEKPGQIRFGDIIIYRNKGGIVCHRLIRRTKDINGNALYQTKADNGNCLDRPVCPEDILGRVSAFKKGDKIIKLDTFSGRISAWNLWAFSLTRVIIHKYAKIRRAV